MRQSLGTANPRLLYCQFWGYLRSLYLRSLLGYIRRVARICAEVSQIFDSLRGLRGVARK